MSGHGSLATRVREGLKRRRILYCWLMSSLKERYSCYSLIRLHENSLSQKYGGYFKHDVKVTCLDIEPVIEHSVLTRAHGYQDNVT